MCRTQEFSTNHWCFIDMCSSWPDAGGVFQDPQATMRTWQKGEWWFLALVTSHCSDGNNMSLHRTGEEKPESCRVLPSITPEMMCSVRQSNKYNKIPQQSFIKVFLYAKQVWTINHHSLLLTKFKGVYFWFYPCNVRYLKNTFLCIHFTCLHGCVLYFLSCVV